ncbi:hypothetical protein MKK67_27270 [Methylobacterium sp. J-072]|uniref:hypothetical protein n=1 Tax=Methylobacterium sp. J-072 TaxID=2836651 RepID=UPI001FB8CD81|nr:hypothetical protein [Methylobacterium sp. J-072]MCJ2096171.1 hypothetical protein [Methylobacterium sp. J-072]
MFDLGGQPETARDWFRLAEKQAGVARTLLAARHTIDAWSHAGFAAECALKAAVCRHQRFNRWPSQAERPDLYTHNFTDLMALAGIDRAQLKRDPVGPAWMTVLLWRRTESYNPGAMPLKMAEDMCAAALGANGVLQWLDSRYRLSI